MFVLGDVVDVWLRDTELTTSARYDENNVILACRNKIVGIVRWPAASPNAVALINEATVALRDVSDIMSLGQSDWPYRRRLLELFTMLTQAYHLSNESNLSADENLLFIVDSCLFGALIAPFFQSVPCLFLDAQPVERGKRAR